MRLKSEAECYMFMYLILIHAVCIYMYLVLIHLVLIHVSMQFDIGIVVFLQEARKLRSTGKRQCA